MRRIGGEDEQFAFRICFGRAERMRSRGSRLPNTTFATEDRNLSYFRAFQILVPIFSNWPNPLTSSTKSGT